MSLMKSLDSVSAEFFLLFWLAALLPVGLGYFVSIDRFESSIYARADAGLASMADLAFARIEAYTQALIDDATLLSRSPELVDFLLQLEHGKSGPELPLRQFLELFVAESGCEDMWLLDRDGRVVYSVVHGEISGLDETQFSLPRPLEEALEAANTLLQTEISDLAAGFASNQDVAFLTAPFFHEGLIVGDVVLQIDNQGLFDVINQYQGLGTTGEIMVGSEMHGKFRLTAPTRSGAGSGTDMSESESAPLRRALRGEMGRGIFRDYRGMMTLNHWRYLPSLNRGMVVKMDVDEIEAPLIHFRRTAMWVALASLALVALGVFLSHRLVATPMVNLANAVQAIQGENLPRKLGVGGFKEIRMLVAAFEALIGRVRAHQHDLEQEVRQRTGELRATNHALTETNAKLVSTNDQLMEALAKLESAQQQLVQSEKMAALGTLVASIAHEINNPNNFISFNVPILEDYLRRIFLVLDHHQGDDEDWVGMPYEEFRTDLLRIIENIAYGSRRIRVTVKNLADYARVRTHFDMRAVDVADIVKRSLMIAEPRLKQASCHVELEMGEALTEVVSDASALEQVFVNVIHNAAQAMPSREGRLTIRLEATASNVEVSIEDNGCGMDQGTLDRIFNPFFTTKTTGEGTGLGLFICHRLMEGLGGSIFAVSEPGVGSTFLIRIPKPTRAPGAQEWDEL